MSKHIIRLIFFLMLHEGAFGEQCLLADSEVLVLLITELSIRHYAFDDVALLDFFLPTLQRIIIIEPIALLRIKLEMSLYFLLQLIV